MKRKTIAGYFGASSATPPQKQRLEEKSSPNCSCEYKTIQNCIGQLEVALKSLDRDTVHFLNREGFITEEVHDDVLNPRSMLTDDQKSGELVTGIRNTVKLSSEKYHILMNYFRQGEKQYDPIVKILDEEYNRQQQKGKEGKVDLATKATPESCFLAHYKKFLTGIYDQDPIARDDKLAIFPCGDFISLALVNSGQSISSDDSFTISTLHGYSVDEILTTKTPLEMDALVTPGSQFVLVEGPPGIGKSTLCWELCRKWDTLKSLEDFKIVLLLKLREQRVQNATSLQDLFFHFDKQLCGDVVKFVSDCKEGEVLLVLDGFDELPSSVVSTENSLIMQLIRGHCLPSVTRLVTSRPSALNLKGSCFPQIYRHVEILGFTDKQKALFAEKAFTGMPEVLTRFKHFIFSNPIITSLMYIPVNCAIIAEIYKALPDIKVPKTMTQLYALLVIVLIRRHLIRIGRWKVESKVPDLEGLPEDIKEDLMSVSELAYMGLMKKDIQITFTDEDVGENFQHLGLLNEAKAMYVFKGTVTNYSFLHLSVQEFLAAWYVSHHPDLAESAATSILSGNYRIKPQFWAFGRFLSGTSEHCFKKLWDLLRPNQVISSRESEICTMYLVCCCYEAKDVSLFNFFSTVLIPVHDPLEMYQFGYAFVHARVKWDLQAHTSFGMLASSIAYHAPDSKILGSLQLDPRTTDVSEFELLPKCILESITLMYLNDVTAPILASLPNLKTVTLQEIGRFTPPINSAMQVSSVRNLQQLGIVVDSLSDSVVEELCSVLTDTKTLQGLCLAPSCQDSGPPLGFTTGRYWCGKELWQFQKLSEAALNCSSLQNLHCTIPFFSYNYSGSLSKVVYYITGEYSMMTLYNCLISIAYMSKSLSTVGIVLGLNTFYILRKPFVNFLTILNSSLSSNPGLGLLAPLFQKFPPCHLQLVSTALRKNPNVADVSLKRSKSLYNLTELRIRTHKIRPVYPWQTTMKRRYVHQSCPDFSELESLNNMHPKLFNVMGALPKFACTQDVQTLSHHT